MGSRPRCAQRGQSAAEQRGHAATRSIAAGQARSSGEGGRVRLPWCRSLTWATVAAMWC